MNSVPFVERDCTFEYNGRTFEAGGAFISPDYLIAYPAKDGRLNDWHGNKIGTWRTIKSVPAIFFGHRSWLGSTFYFMRAIVQGRHYMLRGFGVGMIARGKALKHQPLQQNENQLHAGTL